MQISIVLYERTTHDVVRLIFCSDRGIFRFFRHAHMQPGMDSIILASVDVLCAFNRALASNRSGKEDGFLRIDFVHF